MTWIAIAMVASFLAGVAFTVAIGGAEWGDHRYRQGYDHGYETGRREQANAAPCPTHLHHR